MAQMTAVRFVASGAVGEVPTSRLAFWLARGYELVDVETAVVPATVQKRLSVLETVIGLGGVDIDQIRGPEGDVTPEAMAAQAAAEEAAQDAQEAKTAAAGSAAAAGTAAGTATTAATTATTKAGEAATSAATATTKAGEATTAAGTASTAAGTATTKASEAGASAAAALAALDQATEARDEVVAFAESLGGLDHGTQAAAVTVDATLAAKHQVVLSGNVTATVTTTAGRGDVALRAIQDATGGHSLSIPGVTMPAGWAMPSAPDSEVVITFVRWPDGAIFGYPVSTVLIDATNPTAPTGLTATPSSTSVLLDWSAATDNVAVTGYEYRINGAGSWVNAGLVLSKNVTGLTGGTAYAFEVRSYDAAGNKSAAASVSTTTTYSYSIVVEDTFTAADGTLVNAHAPNTGPSNLWASVNAAYTIVGNRFYTNLLDNTQADSAFVDTGGKVMRLTQAYDLTEQKVGNASRVRLHFWNGGTRTGSYTARNTNHIVMVAKATYNASVAALTASTAYSSPADTVTLTPAGGHNLAAVPLSGTLMVKTYADDTFEVYVDGVLWATGAKLIDPSATPGVVTVGQFAAAGISGGKAYIDSVKFEHGS